ncbi:MAG: hypothetical protein LC798_12895 [Chloroflexi bacterium]|nr:hypothetical protein [Chloroflexota bacterium]
MLASPKAAAKLEQSLNYGDMGKTDCPEGCKVEPDGSCPHGYESAGLTAGMI